MRYGILLRIPLVRHLQTRLVLPAEEPPEPVKYTPALVAYVTSVCVGCGDRRAVTTQPEGIFRSCLTTRFAPDESVCRQVVS
jgi:hypothetical protein